MSESATQLSFFNWCELMTTDVESAKAFYSELIGWKLETGPSPNNDGEYTQAIPNQDL